MTALNKQALREAAQEEIMLRSVSDTSDAWQDEASPEAVLALLDDGVDRRNRTRVRGVHAVDEGVQSGTAGFGSVLPRSQASRPEMLSIRRPLTAGLAL